MLVIFDFSFKCDYISMRGKGSPKAVTSAKSRKNYDTFFLISSFPASVNMRCKVYSQIRVIASFISIWKSSTEYVFRCDKVVMER